MIELRPSSIIIHNYDKPHSVLERSLSIWDPINFRVDKVAMFEEEDKLIIPGGYDIEALKSFFPDKEFVDNRFKVQIKAKDSKFKVNGNPRDIRQQNALNFLEASTNYFAYSANRTQKMLSLETGGGKTFVTILFASRYGKLPMVIVDNDKMMTQWKDEFLKLTDIEEDEIGIISGSSSIRRILKEEKRKYKVYIASHRTLASYGKDNPYVFQPLFKKLGIGLKIFDEAHVEWRNIFLLDSYTDVGLTLYLTATPARSDHRENIVYQNMFFNVVQYGLEHKYKEEKNYHKVVFINMDSKPREDVVIKLSDAHKYGFNINGWCKYILQDDKYPDFIEVIEKILNVVYTNRDKSKVAIVVHTLDMVEKVHRSISELYPDKEIGNFSGLIKNREEREKELEKEIIITTDKSFDKGVNVMDLEVLINTVPLSSKVKIEQLLGRLRYVEGKPTIFFDITDIGFPVCKRQRASRKKILDLKAKEVFEMKL